jgi:hypothetical protein
MGAKIKSKTNLKKNLFLYRYDIFKARQASFGSKICEKQLGPQNTTY